MMNILVALNDKYVPPLRVMLKSMFENNPGEHFSVYLMYSDIPPHEMASLERFVEREGHRLIPVYVADDLFKDAVVLRHYTKEMYYRLAAHLFLPEHLDRILYLDPDIVVLNAIGELYWIDFGQCYFVASEHTHAVKMTGKFNHIRLGIPRDRGYYNSGVLLMNLELMRKNVDLKQIAEFIEEHKHKLILPDQDVLNGLYWDKIKPVDGLRYNFDARFYEVMKYIPKQKINLEWIKENTLFLHYCGKKKPWHKSYKNELGQFYRQYENMLNLQLNETR